MNDSSSSTPHSIFIDVLYICVNPTTPKSSEKVGTTDITGAVLSTRKPLDEDSLHSPIIKQMTVSLFYLMHRLVISFFPINEIDDGKINLPIASIYSAIINYCHSFFFQLCGIGVKRRS